MRFLGTKLRLWVQIIYTIITNGYLYGFLNGKIYKGALKYSCLPGLNCYSCPGALGACPIGALQAAFNQRKLEIPFAVLGFFFVFGSIFGRFVCGWLCPFGLVQDLVYKIPLFKKLKRLPGHKYLKYIKYVMLFALVGIGSIFLFKGFAKIPAFCKYVCPSGTLLGAVPLMAVSEQLRMQIGNLFFWKFSILILVIFVSIKVYRPFCQYLCPLGAIYGWFNRFSLVQIKWNQDDCILCMNCKKACPVDLGPEEISVSPECIKCGQCITACPTGCIQFQAGRGDKKINKA